MNDKFGYTLKNKDTRYKTQFENVADREGEYSKLNEDEQKRFCRAMGADCPNLYSRHLTTQLWNQQTKGDFDVIFDSTMKDIAAENYVDITEEEFNSQMKKDIEELTAMFAESHRLEEEIQRQLAGLRFCD